jgi:IS1 family transposase
MNKLPMEKRAQILEMLCEGSSMRSISRIADVSINTVTKLLVDAGMACAAYHNEHVKGVTSKKIQCDEIWSFCYAKAKTAETLDVKGAGDAWTWTAIDADSKLIVSYFVGDRSAESAWNLMTDLQTRLANRVQLTSDGHKAYLEMVSAAFGNAVDFGMLVKLYGKGDTQGRYSPPQCIGAKKTSVIGNPDPKYISTSYVERQNLNMRMGMRRFTRLTNAFSKKLENHCHALALYFMFYNFVRIHKTLKTSPAMAAGITKKLWEMNDIVNLLDLNSN